MAPISKLRGPVTARLTSLVSPRPALRLQPPRLAPPTMLPGRLRTAQPGPLPPRRGTALLAFARKIELYEQKPLPDLEELDKAQVLAELSQFPYARDASKLPSDFAPAAALMRTLQEKLGLPVVDMDSRQRGRRGKMDLRLPGTVIDRQSGLVACALASPSTKQVVLVFGGTGAGPIPMDLKRGPLDNSYITMRQWVANIEAAGGHMPDSYKQAVRLANGMAALLKEDGEWTGYVLGLDGHSKGGGEASTAALLMDDPVKAIVFSPAPVSDDILRHAPPGHLAQAKSLVESYSVARDPVPETGNPQHCANPVLNAVGLGPRSVGTAHIIPATPHVDADGRTRPLTLLERHLQVDQQLALEIARRRAGLPPPADLPPDLLEADVQPAV